MRFVEISNPVAVLEVGEVLARFPETIFPSDARLIDFAALGFSPIQEGAIPLVDEQCESLERGELKLEGGVWVQTYCAVALPDAEIAARRLAATEAAAGQILGAVMNHMNSRAAERRYDSIQSAALRAAYPGPYHDEGVAYGTWMDECLAYGYGVVAQLRAGEIEAPAPESVIDALPDLALPAQV